MADPFKLVRIPTLKTVEDFRNHIASLGIELPCEDKIETGVNSPLTHPVEIATINGKTIGNRIAIQPMEGWDGTTTGGISEEMVRRWKRFGESGAKLIFGGEAMAVRPDGRANPNQLIISEENKSGIAQLRETLIATHKERYSTADDLVIGFQLTHSGRFCRPNDKKVWESRVAYRHPILDQKFNVTSDAQILSDSDVEEIIQAYVGAAKVAEEIGADFVDIKHCHGYLLHEFLGAFTRPGKYGGSFENRTRILREIVAGIRASGNKIDLAVRLSAFDFVPFKPDPTRAQPGKLGPGIPEEFPLPYPYAFGANQNNPLETDLSETILFAQLCGELGIKILNLSAGSPYYNPHIQRPAAYPPSDGYQPDHDPLIDVARQINAVRQVKEKAPAGLIVVGSAYSYLQEFLPQVSQYVIRNGWTDLVGIGRMVLSYPDILAEAAEKGTITPKVICRTFSDCTTAPRNGLISGCYPLDKYYSAKPEFQKLKEIKKATGA
ncbi:MAG: NADH:flavin oxidoreductase [Verrucomicrobia bacterium]|nr:NADH:flavin oxidoreductase [Verrucomicrobiota bacterium]